MLLERGLEERPPARLIHHPFHWTERLGSPGQQQVRVELKITMGHEDRSQFCTLRSRTHDRSTPFHASASAELHIATIAPVEPHHMNDRQLREPESCGERLQYGQDFRGSGNFKWLACKEVLLHVDCNECHRSEIRTSIFQICITWRPSVLTAAVPGCQ